MYLKISEACNRRCRFCIIPQLLGSLVSRPIDEIMGEAENLVGAGVQELLVVSHDTSAYGVDIKHRLMRVVVTTNYPHIQRGSSGI